MYTINTSLTTKAHNARDGDDYGFLCLMLLVSGRSLVDYLKPYLDFSLAAHKVGLNYCNTLMTVDLNDTAFKSVQRTTLDDYPISFNHTNRCLNYMIISCQGLNEPLFFRCDW